MALTGPLPETIPLMASLVEHLRLRFPAATAPSAGRWTQNVCEYCGARVLALWPHPSRIRDDEWRRLAISKGGIASLTAGRCASCGATFALSLKALS